MKNKNTKGAFGRASFANTFETGSIDVSANDQDCFTWKGTQRDARYIQRFYLKTVQTINRPPESCAKRMAGYLMVFGMPKIGDVDHRPSNRGKLWDAVNIEFCKSAVLWLAFRQPIPNIGSKIEDYFPGKQLIVSFIGDRDQVLYETAREQRGEPFTGESFTMQISVKNYGNN
jgi:hypothetical protein